MGSVTVCGSATRFVQPDRVMVSLGLSHVAATADDALHVVAKRSNALTNLLKRLKIGRSEWVTDGVTVAEEWQWKNDANVLVGYRANAGVTVTLGDTELVGRLLGDAVSKCSANIRHLAWQVDADNPARRQILGAAALDARLRAEAYTAALGLRLGEVEVISEEPMAGATAPQPEVHSMMRAAKAADATLDVSGGQVELRGQVYVRFGTLS